MDEYGRALYAVARSIVRALWDQLSDDDLRDLNCARADVTYRQLAKLARLERDKGMRGDGFEWAVHEAIVGKEPRVTDYVSSVLKKASRYIDAQEPTSLLFGYERARILGFLDAIVDTAGQEALLLPDGRGHPYAFGPWVQVAANGQAAEARLNERIRQIWKTDLFLGDDKESRYIAATVKSNWHQLEEGKGLRIGIVPEASDLRPGISRQGGLWVIALPDPNGFTGLFNDAYMAVAQAICTIGKHDRPPYFTKPSAKGIRLQEQLEKYPTAKVMDIDGALNEAAQQNLVTVNQQLVGIDAPKWLHITERPISIIAPKPKFEKIE